MPPVRMNPVRLDDLIDAITAVHGESLDQLVDAVLLADHLGEMSDHLVGHFVDRARRSGASWTDIGRSMGVTKQAAQKRFVPKGDRPPLDPEQGFGRFTPGARAVVVTAQNEVQAAGNAEIGPAHLILGLLADPEAVGARAITAQGIALDTVRRTVTITLPAPTAPAPDLVPFDAPARKALELTFREALRLGHDDVGTGHVLLALLDLEDGGGVLTGLGVDGAATRTYLAARAADDGEARAGRGRPDLLSPDQPADPAMLTSQETPKRSMQAPNSSPHICFSSGVSTVPPSERRSHHPRSVGASSPESEIVTVLPVMTPVVPGGKSEHIRVMPASVSIWPCMIRSASGPSMPMVPKVMTLDVPPRTSV